MEKKLKKMVDETIRCLNWDLIMDFYVSTDDDSTFSSKKGITKDQIKGELMNVVEFVLNNNVTEFQADQWIITCKDSDHGMRLEIIFTPTNGCTYDNDELSIDVECEDDEVDVLQDLLDKSVQDENYELAAVLRDRINKLKKPKKLVMKDHK